MKLTLRQILNATQAFQKLINTDLPANIRFRAKRFVKQIIDISKDFQEQNSKLIEKYGAKNEKGIMEVLPEKFAEFSVEIDVLLKEEVELKEEDLPDDVWGYVTMSLSDEENIKPFKKVKE